MKIQGRVLLLTIFVIVAFAMGFYSILRNHTPLLSASDSPCPIVYGNVTCIDGRPVIPFFNPNLEDLNEIKINVPKSNGIDIYEVNQSLAPNKTEVLILHETSCDPVPMMADFKLEWCCSLGCYTVKMSEPGEDFELEVHEQEYPEYPTADDCASLVGNPRRFCYNDLAEISGDLSVCQLIDEPDIRTHCIARITMDEELCKQIPDSELYLGCVESISMKRQWGSSESLN